MKTAKIVKVDIDAVYLTDKGRALCREHLGALARTTGRDRSGRLIHHVTPWDVEEAGPIVCEICGRAAFPATAITLVSSAGAA